MAILIGTAGWAIPRSVADMFPSEGSALQRYSTRFAVAEINSSFHRAHRLETWSSWHDSVPDHFRFSVKLPKQITHSKKLVGCASELDAFLEQVSILEQKLAVILVQLPPKLEFDEAVARQFFERLCSRSGTAVVCEPRHPSWFTQQVNEYLEGLHISRVAADPSICPAQARPGGWHGIAYWRLHGSPVVYRSSYQDRLESYVEQLRSAAISRADVWCIFDNTASGSGASDGLLLQQRFLTAEGERVERGVGARQTSVPSQTLSAGRNPRVSNAIAPAALQSEDCHSFLHA